jgi:hypothetical protein
MALCVAAGAEMLEMNGALALTVLHGREATASEVWWLPKMSPDLHRRSAIMPLTWVELTGKYVSLCAAANPQLAIWGSVTRLRV